MNCLYCGKELPRQHKKYCSRECYSKSGGPNKQKNIVNKRYCLTCGKEFTGRGDNYCSRECYNKGPTHGKPPRKERKLCIVCGKEISTKNQRFCSIACMAKNRIGKGNQAARRRTVKICPQCGKEFEVGGRAGHREQVFCSRACGCASHRKLGGYRAWQRLSAEVIARDGHCVLCGNGERRLQAHHVIPRSYEKWSEFEGIETADDLITVCPGCHQSIEALTKAGYRNNPSFNPWDLIKMVRNITQGVIKGGNWHDKR